MRGLSTRVNHLENIFKSFGVLVSGIVIAFLQSGSFKALGVLFEDIVRQYKTSNLFGGWALTFQPAATFVIPVLVEAY
ncbi:hypothetical protein HOLleu_08766 [Holothuria leucospilota]|uniref:Uncharacterized protein n=1 Tax=Holothuria leucospilota TaxID=206669 RepID=A0A9Q1CI38_HOLLE|nr:hypothetical protein HOLleu_08766 [Holothuria leucospilota]